ncbi:oxidoreductase [Amnibacterium setariae]|uniref:SDR family NAD(P)-dependent oxidoreductase n=1 Tax=Amnibacterium setariae TaxID=2306585 RepID=A0A3A1TWP0_9MICO|nr:oxidoreductase [Amnibacterium setariae]RIX28622.1 SDR family NAD(P)-dependent oxidoreductase [Amnibacterium setariae]
MRTWTSNEIPDQRGRTAVITGANAGLGAVAARRLAARGASVVLAARRLDAGRAAAEAIRAELPSARIEVRELDLASLDSVRGFAEGVRRDLDQVDLLINNAGTMRGPFRRSADGHELQLAVNHLGHYALTGLLLPLLTEVPGSRVVVLSSTEHRFGRLDLDRLDDEAGYDSRRAYQRAKLANTVFGLELHRRLVEHGSRTIAVLAHPGIAKTTLARNGATAAERLLVRSVTALLGQSAEEGARAELFAATDPSVRGGAFFGPTGRGEARGPVGEVAPGLVALETGLGEQLWHVSERLTGVRYLDSVAA